MAVVYHQRKSQYGSSILFDLVFSEAHEEMKLTSSATETSFLNEQDGEYEEERNGEKKDILSGADEMDENNELESEIDASNEINIGNTT